MELNKIAAAILLAGLIAMITGKVSSVLYYGSMEPEAEHEITRGYTVEGADAFADGAAGGGGAAVEKELPPIAPLMAAADAAAGEAYFAKKCATCHNADKGGPNQTGPNLWGVLGRDAGSHAGFSYSKAMAAHEGDWGYEELNHFITKPKKYIAGTIMGFAGEPKDTTRANIIAFLRSRSDSPLPLPVVKAAPEPAATAEPAKDFPTPDKSVQDAVENSAPAADTEKPKE